MVVVRDAEGIGEVVIEGDVALVVPPQRALPAQEAGLAGGDVITSLGGTTITTPNDLTNAISQYHPGDKVSIGWTDSSGQTHTATVQLSSGPPQ